MTNILSSSGGTPVKVEREYVYVQRFVDDHGREYFYYRPAPFKRKTRIRATPDDPVAFEAAYDEARARYERHNGIASPAHSPMSRPAEGTFRWLCVEHFKSQRFKDLDPDTQRVSRRVLEQCLAEPWRRTHHCCLAMHRCDASMSRRSSTA